MAPTNPQRPATTPDAAARSEEQAGAARRAPPLLARPATLRALIIILTAALCVLGLIGSGQIFNRAFLGMARRNLEVTAVDRDGPAERAGIQVGDEILAVNDIDASQNDTLCRLQLRNARVGETLHLTLRPDRQVELVGAAPPRSEVIWRFAMGLTGLCALALGFFIAYQHPEKLTLVFFGICYMMALLMREHPRFDSQRLLLAHELLYLLVPWLLPALFVHFFLLFPERPPSRRRRLLERLLYVPALLMLLVWQLPATAPDLDRLRLEALQNVFEVIYWLTYTGLAVALFVRAYRRTRTAALRGRLRVVVWGTVLGIAIPSAVLVMVSVQPSLYRPSVRYALLALVLIPASFAYAAFRHRVFDFEILLKRSVLYSTLSALLVATYFAVVAGLGALLHNLTGASNPLLVLVSLVAVALLAAPARAHLQRLVDRVFFRERYDARATLRRFTHDLARMLELGGIATLLVRRVGDLLDVEPVTLLLREASAPTFRPIRAIPETAGAAGELSAAAVGLLLGQQARPINLEEAGEAARLELLPLTDRRALQALQPVVLVPLRARERLLGLLVLGPRRGLGWTSQADLEILETLGEQAALAIQNALLHQQALEKQRVARELAVAQGVQALLVPGTDPQTEGIEFASSTVACHEIGGDFYDYVPLEDGRLGVAIGDVSGKGIPAALLMAGLQSCFRTEAERGQDPAAVLRALNHRILTVSGDERFVCFFYGILRLDERQMIYANAGLDPPILVRQSGRVERLLHGGPILGVVEEPRYSEGKISLDPGDTLVLFTDGLVEPVENRTGEGEDALVRFLVEHRNAGARELLDRALERLRRLAGEHPGDDMTLIIAQGRQRAHGTHGNRPAAADS